MPPPLTLPDFVVVGAQRSGSTYLHALLSQHPAIHMPHDKELHYFDLVPGRGGKVDLAAYAAKFGDPGPATVLGEATPSYMYFPWVPEMLGTYLPEARLIFTLRDPVKRAYSHYWKEVHDGFERLDFEDALAAEPERLRGSHREQVAFSYRDRGFYMRQIERFLPQFPRERMLVLMAEDLYGRPAETLERVWAFLGVPPASVETEGDELLGHYGPPDELPRYLRLLRIQRALEGRRGAWRIARMARRRRLRINQGTGGYPPMREETRDDLARGFGEDATALQAFLGEDLSRWSVFGARADLK